MARYMTDIERKALREFQEELLESLKKLRNEIKFKKVKAN